MTATYRHLRLYKRPGSYIGATWYGYYPVFGRSRDSHVIEASNFDVAWRKLSALQSWAVAGPDDLNGETEGTEFETVVRTECNHWAVGWVETLYVHSSNMEACQLADELREEVAGYPILDEEDVSNREWEAAAKFWGYSSVRGRLEAIKSARTDVSPFAARRAEFPQGDDNGALFDYCRE